MTRYLSTRQAAELLGVHPTTVRNWIRAGKLEAIRLPGGQLRIDVQALDRLRGTTITAA